MQCVRLTRTLMVIFPLVISLLAGVTVISAKFLAREQPNPVNVGLIFQNTRNNAWYWVHADGTGLESLIEFSNVGFPDETHVDNGTLSPDGRWLAASSGSLDSIVLRFWLINMETRAMTLLNVPTATQKRFVWSPDSRFVAYIENGLVELIDIQSGVQTTLTDMRIVAGSSGSSSSLAWSPDSRQLIFDYTTANASPYRAISASYSLWMINVDGTGLHQMSIEGAALNPVWDSQTNHLYYVCRHLFSEVCTLDVTRDISVRVPLPNDLLYMLDDFIVSLRDVYADELILGDVLPNGDLFLYDVNSERLTTIPQTEDYSVGRIYWFAHP